VKKKIYLSLIITTFNREKNIFEIINSIGKQICILKDSVEIIICDSNSTKKLSLLNFIKQFKGIKINHYNCKINHQAFKRNYGIKNSSGRNKIFIDDDCFPERKFLYNYLKILSLNRKKNIYFGLVNYVNFKQNENLIKYRQSRVFCSPNHENVPYKNFLTMNMAYNDGTILKNEIFFDNRFRNYGFEDFEFAYRFKKKKYKLLQIKSIVFHRDNRNFEDFLNKYNFLGSHGINDIIKINITAAKDLIYYRIEKNFLIGLFLKIPLIRFFLAFMQKSISFYEKKTKFYNPLIYSLGIVVAYLKGVSHRSFYLKEKNYNLKDQWYK
jgi:glycosyltransferase involved in cell wall biosynthesis